MGVRKDTTTTRVTVTLPGDVVREIDQIEKNRSRFIVDAVRHEVQHRRRPELLRSLRHPHPESVELAELGLAEWAGQLPPDDGVSLVDPEGGTPIRWAPGRGWIDNDT
jgi:hypothetical protein